MLSLIQSLISGGRIVLGVITDGMWGAMTSVDWEDVGDTDWDDWDETAES